MLTQTLELAWEADDLPAASFVHGNLGRDYWELGDLDRALTHAERAVEPHRGIAAPVRHRVGANLELQAGKPLLIIFEDVGGRRPQAGEHRPVAAGQGRRPDCFPWRRAPGCGLADSAAWSPSSQADRTRTGELCLPVRFHARR